MKSCEQGHLEKHGYTNKHGGGDNNIAGEAADSANRNVDRSRLFTGVSTTRTNWAGSMSRMCSMSGIIRLVRITGIVRMSRVIRMVWMVKMVGVMGMVGMVEMVGVMGMVRMVGMVGMGGMIRMVRMVRMVKIGRVIRMVGMVGIYRVIRMVRMVNMGRVVGMVGICKVIRMVRMVGMGRVIGMVNMCRVVGMVGVIRMVRMVGMGRVMGMVRMGRVMGMVGMGRVMGMVGMVGIVGMTNTVNGSNNRESIRSRNSRGVRGTINTRSTVANAGNIGGKVNSGGLANIARLNGKGLGGHLNGWRLPLAGTGSADNGRVTPSPGLNLREYTTIITRVPRRRNRVNRTSDGLDCNGLRGRQSLPIMNTCDLLANQGDIDIHHDLNTNRDFNGFRIGHRGDGMCSHPDGVITRGTRINNLVHINSVAGLAAKEISTATSLHSSIINRITSMAIIIVVGTDKLR